MKQQSLFFFQCKATTDAYFRRALPFNGHLDSYLIDYCRFHLTKSLKVY